MKLFGLKPETLAKLRGAPASVQIQENDFILSPGGTAAATAGPWQGKAGPGSRLGGDPPVRSLLGSIPTPFLMG